MASVERNEEDEVWDLLRRLGIGYAIEPLVARGVCCLSDLAELSTSDISELTQPEHTKTLVFVIQSMSKSLKLVDGCIDGTVVSPPKLALSTRSSESHRDKDGENDLTLELSSPTIGSCRIPSSQTDGNHDSENTSPNISINSTRNPLLKSHASKKAVDLSSKKDVCRSTTCEQEEYPASKDSERVKRSVQKKNSFNSKAPGNSKTGQYCISESTLSRPSETELDILSAIATKEGATAKSPVSASSKGRSHRSVDIAALTVQAMLQSAGISIPAIPEHSSPASGRVNLGNASSVSPCAQQQHVRSNPELAERCRDLMVAHKTATRKSLARLKTNIQLNKAADAQTSPSIASSLCLANDMAAALDEELSSLAEFRDEIGRYHRRKAADLQDDKKKGNSADHSQGSVGGR
mmetsp:Transcript_88630/g.171628  ORF Transcript_88630/g.171628 Transcript_88630/m.171628 type:complete len:408 (+) Transcript_88630:44-1267(+)